jgi:Holliday junction resolvase
LKGDEAVVLMRSEMDIVKLLRNGESETVEFKARFNKETIMSLAAFANTKGGKVIVGVDNKGRVTGIDMGPETKKTGGRVYTLDNDFLSVKGVDPTFFRKTDKISMWMLDTDYDGKP